MGKILVIAEKPSVASDYAKALNQFSKKEGYYEGDRYVITWALGHIVSRKELMEYDPNINRAPQNRAHVIETIPFFPEKHILKLPLVNLDYIKGDKKKVEAAKYRNSGLKERAAVFTSLFKRNDIDFVVNGCDSGREGEAIFWQIYEYFQCNFPVKRLWISSNVTEDIINGFNDLKPASQYENLKQASYARAEMDWEHGLNLSALYASLYGAQLSVGRVQTPLLNMIVERELEITNFKPKDYYLLDASFSTTDNFTYKGRLVINGELKDFSEEGKLTDVSKINEIVSRIENKQGFVKSIEKTKKKESPKLLFNLSELQIEMSAKHKMSAQEVLATAQSLYETHKLTTYPRTSSQYLNTTMKDDVFDRLNYLPKDYDNAVTFAKNSGCFFDKILNDSKVEDHYALIPTKTSRNFDFSKLSKNEMIVYTAITKRFISLFMPNHEYESTVLTTSVDGFDFKTTGKRITQQGWKALYSSNKEEVEEESQDISNQDLTYAFEKDMTVLCDKADKQAKKTQPPKRYTDGTLISTMKVGGPKNSGIDDPEKLEMLKEKGLGTEATRAGLIENIINKGYVEKDKKSYFYPTAKGLDFISKIKIDMLKSPEITGDWEHKLKLVEKGQLRKSDLIKDVRIFITDCVEKTKASYKEGDRIVTGTPVDAKCPLCGKPILKSPKAYFCEGNGDGCKFVIFSNILGKTLKDNDIKDICNKGITKIIKGFANPNKKDANGKPTKFDAALAFNKETLKLQFSFNGGVPKEKKETDYKCPKCGKNLYEMENGYGCSGYKDGCRFSFFKNIFNKKLSESDIKDLLEKGSTEVFEDLYNPKNPNRKFKAKIILKEDNPEIVYLNENNEEDSGKPSSYFCPCCNTSMVEYDNYYRCSKCKFAIFKNVAGVKLSHKNINDICTEKKMLDFVDFTSKAGKPFRARLVLNTKTKKLEFQMETKSSSYTCPICGGDIGEQDSTFDCLKCGFKIWKSIGSVKLADKYIAEIFKNKETSEYVELISSKGKPFKAKLAVNEKTKKVEFVFEERK